MSIQAFDYPFDLSHDPEVEKSDSGFITGTRYTLGPAMRPLPSPPLPVPRQRLRPFRHQVTRTRSEAPIPGTLTISLNSKLLEKPSSLPNRKEYQTIVRA